ncbi:MAG: hypothetical protein LUE96_04760 [Lachnospiraceae bacterium]|nr:hypothetical protein [Lachnospiraceae bacterium]
MDSRAKKTALLIVICSAIVIMAAVAAVNINELPDRSAKNSDAQQTASVSQVIEEDGRVSGADLSAFLRDSDFFDSDAETDGQTEETQTDAEESSGTQRKGTLLTLLASSVERDIRVKITDADGEPVAGEEFMVVVEDTGAYVDEDRDGIILISDVKPGEYKVSLSEADGYEVPADPVNVRVKSIVSYTVIDDIEFFVHSEDEVDTAADDTETGLLDITDEDDTQYTSLLDLEGERENAVSLGIDVSKWNNEIDWELVKAEGVDFAIIRCGYRGSSTGWLIEDPYFYKNLEGAKKAGIRVGVYFFSQAVDLVEAVEEASMVVTLLGDTELDYPVFIDTESAGGNGRADNLDINTRTAVINAFCRTIENAGYTAGVYASRNWYLGNINMDELGSWKIWLAEYRQTPEYEGRYDLWQYTSSGAIAGIEGRVDLNVSYIGMED